MSCQLRPLARGDADVLRQTTFGLIDGLASRAMTVSSSPSQAARRAASSVERVVDDVVGVVVAVRAWVGGHRVGLFRRLMLAA